MPSAPAKDERGARVGRFILILGLLGCLAGLALTGFCWWQARQDEKAFERTWAQALDSENSGASVYRLRLDLKRPNTYQYTPLMVSPLEWEQGPIPEAEDYKIKALAGIVLDVPQKLSFRVRGDDGVSILIQGEPVFDQWKPYPGAIDARFSQEVPAGQLLLEVDYLQYDTHVGLSVEIRDESGRPLDLLPLKADVDVPAWLAKRASRDAWDRRTVYALALALLLGLVPVVWGLIRDPQRFLDTYEKLKPLGLGFWPGLCLAMLAQMSRLMSTQDGDDLLPMLGVPLACGLIGALLSALVRRLLGPERRRIWSERLLTHEAKLLPGAAFVFFAAYVSWSLYNLGAYLPHAFLEAPWDAQQYKDIALNWYHMTYTETGGVSGNYPWHMLLPILARGWHALGVDMDLALLMVVWPASLAVFYLIYRLARELYGVRAARWSLAALACYPCSWYLLIGYPYSLAMALGMGYFLAVRSRRLLWAALLGYLLGMSYITAVLAAAMPLFIMWPELRRTPDPWPELRFLLLVTAAPALGLLTFCFNHWLLFNQFLLPITGHEMWGRKAALPWVALVEGLLHEPPHYPEAIILVMIIGALLVFAHRFQVAFWVLICLTVAAGPGTGDLEAVYRQNLMAWPLFVLIGSSPRGRLLKLSWLWLCVYFALKWYLPLWLSRDLV